MCLSHTAKEQQDLRYESGSPVLQCLTTPTLPDPWDPCQQLGLDTASLELARSIIQRVWEGSSPCPNNRCFSHTQGKYLGGLAKWVGGEGLISGVCFGCPA